MILGINTAERVHELVLLGENPSKKGEWELLAEKIWPDERRDVEDLTSFLEGLLEQIGLSKEEITDIVVVRGPGSFTSLRTGVAFGNALAFALGTQLHALTTFELLRLKAATKDPVLSLVHAGRMEAAVQFNEDPVRIGPLAFVLNDFPHNSAIQVVAELPETLEEELHPIVLEKGWTRKQGHELQSLGEVLMTFGLEKCEKLETVEPLYLKGAHITKSSDPWKQ